MYREVLAWDTARLGAPDGGRVRSSRTFEAKRAALKREGKRENQVVEEPVPGIDCEAIRLAGQQPE